MPEPVLQSPPQLRARRPDPRRGIFETMLVLDGRPVELDAHLARLRTSLAALFGETSPPDLADEIRDSVRAIAAGSVRLAAAPREGGLHTEIAVRRTVPAGAIGDLLPVSGSKSPTRQAALESLALPGGLGPHKWADRSLLDAAHARLPAGALPLLFDEDGSALEASRANLFAVRGGALFTPPLDGRILPGVTRMRVLEIAAAADLETHEVGLRCDDLLEAEEVFLTGSVRGVEHVGSLDGARLDSRGEITECVSAGLWRVWRNAGGALR